MISYLQIQTSVRNGVTRLKESYYTPPFKVVNVTENKQVEPLHLMLMCSSPGILEGDDYRLKITIEENSHLHLHTQSYQRLFNMKQGARQNMEVYLQRGASLIYIPHPAVPHNRSVFITHNKIFLQGNNRLLWSEILTCGRKLNGEQFDFIKYHSITDIYINGKLSIKENWLVQPGITDVNTIGQWEGYTHQASIIIVDDQENTASHYDNITTFLNKQPGIAFGISSLPVNGIIVRILGYKAEQLFNCVNQIGSFVTINNTGPVKPEGIHVN